MNIRPLHNQVIVKRLEPAGQSKGGILLPDNVKERPQEAMVIAVGPGVRDEHGNLQPLDVKVGDRILFGKWSGAEVKVDDEQYLVMKESDILGVFG